MSSILLLIAAGTTRSSASGWPAEETQMQLKVSNDSRTQVRGKVMQVEGGIGMSVEKSHWVLGARATQCVCYDQGTWQFF